MTPGGDTTAEGCIPVEVRPHDAYTFPLEGGFRGYVARCWDCDWIGAEHLRGDEPMGTEASRNHKRQAQQEAAEHARTHTVAACSKCHRTLRELEASA